MACSFIFQVAKKEKNAFMGFVSFQNSKIISRSTESYYTTKLPININKEDNFMIFKNKAFQNLKNINYSV